MQADNALDLFGAPLADLEIQAHTILERAIQRHDPVAILGLFSGGIDSLAAVHIASQHPRFTGCLHINTGIGIPETSEFVADVCSTYKWPYHAKWPGEVSTEWTYEDMVLAKGFPGPGAHRYAYSWLKQRALRRATQEFKQHRTDRVLMVSGVRGAESARRMGYAAEEYREGARVFVSPLLYWPSGTPRQYAKQNNLFINPVAENLHRSGECNCGAFAPDNERGLVAAFYPAFENYLAELEYRAARRGVHAAWGQRPSPVLNDYPEMPKLPMIMCSSCTDEEVA